MATLIQLDESSNYELTQYGILYVGRYVHQIVGATHNRRADFAIKVWDNTNRPNTCPEGKYTDFGRYGGPGRYLGPDNIGTDDPISVTTSAQAVIISSEPFPRTPQGERLRLGSMVRLVLPDGTPLGDFIIAEKALHDPHLTPAA